MIRNLVSACRRRLLQQRISAGDTEINVDHAMHRMVIWIQRQVSLGVECSHRVIVPAPVVHHRSRYRRIVSNAFYKCHHTRTRTEIKGKRRSHSPNGTTMVPQLRVARTKRIADGECGCRSKRHRGLSKRARQRQLQCRTINRVLCHCPRVASVWIDAGAIHCVNKIWMNGERCTAIACSVQQRMSKHALAKHDTQPLIRVVCILHLDLHRLRIAISGNGERQIIHSSNHHVWVGGARCTICRCRSGRSGDDRCLSSVRRMTNRSQHRRILSQIRHTSGSPRVPLEIRSLVNVRICCFDLGNQQRVEHIVQNIRDFIRA
mmetsp:Transcript_32499/g.52682  ORF Transcript_32499/g.52682 Transcript_32499/m.52682 type:complete len:319 (-) Transcript_32499:520-1476(-)